MVECCWCRRTAYALKTITLFNLSASNHTVAANTEAAARVSVARIQGSLYVEYASWIRGEADDRAESREVTEVRFAMVRGAGVDLPTMITAGGVALFKHKADIHMGMPRCRLPARTE